MVSYTIVTHCRYEVVQMIDSKGLLVSASYDQNIRFWDATTGKTVLTMPHAEAQVNAMCLVPNSPQLAVGSWQKVRIFDISIPQPVILTGYEGVTRNITAVGFEVTARWMFSGGDDGICRVYDIRSSLLQCQRSFEASAGITSVVLHPNQVELFIADQAGRAFVWDLSKSDSPEYMGSIPVPKLSTLEFIVKLAIHPVGHQLVGITNRGNLITWDLVQWELESDQNALMVPSTCARYKGMKNISKASGLSIRYTPNGANIVITFSDNYIQVLKSDDLSLHSYNAESRWNWDAVFTCDSRKMFTGGDDHKIKVWDIENPNHLRIVAKYEGHSKAITAICLSGNS